MNQNFIIMKIIHYYYMLNKADQNLMNKIIHFLYLNASIYEFIVNKVFLQRLKEILMIFLFIIS